MTLIVNLILTSAVGVGVGAGLSVDTLATSIAPGVDHWAVQHQLTLANTFFKKKQDCNKNTANN